MYVSEICTEGFEKWVKVGQNRRFFFQMSAILKLNFQKRKQFHFSEENFLNYTHIHPPTHTHTHTQKTQFCMWQLNFHQIKGKQEQAVDLFGCPYAPVKGHLEPTHLKSSPLFTFSTKSLTQDSPSIHLFSKIIGSRFTTPQKSWVKIHQADLFFLGQDSL